MKNATSKGRKRHLTAQCVDRALGPIIRNRPVKTIAYAAGRSEDTVKRWRTMLPETWAAFINLLTSDDEVYLTVMEMAGRKPIASLTDEQRRSVAEALRILGDAQ